MRNPPHTYAVADGPDPSDSRDLATQTYDQLQRLILTARLAPGSRIIESDLAARLGVSRTPVRSALQRLQQEGYIVALEGGKHARLAVAPLTEEDGRELFSVLGALEGVAARRVAALAPQRRRGITGELRDLSAGLREASLLDRPDLEGVFRLQTRFHGRLVESAEAPRLQALHAAVGPQAERYRRVYLTSQPHGLGAEALEQEEILDRIEGGDGPAAQLAVQASWEATAERLGGLIARIGARGQW